MDEDDPNVRVMRGDYDAAVVIRTVRLQRSVLANIFGHQRCRTTCQEYNKPCRNCIGWGFQRATEVLSASLADQPVVLVD